MVYIKELYDELTETCAKLDKKMRKLSSRRYRFVRAITTGHWLVDLDSNAVCVDEVLHDVVKASLASQNTAADRRILLRSQKTL